ncbi:MAG: YggT family protein [Chloroflexales bacterium]
MRQPRTKIAHFGPPRVALLVAWGAGVLEALLLARLVARLLAARPTHPAFALLSGITSPFVIPLAALDFDQSPFGAALEYATLGLIGGVPLIAYLLWVGLTRHRSAAS